LLFFAIIQDWGANRSGTNADAISGIKSGLNPQQT